MTTVKLNLIVEDEDRVYDMFEVFDLEKLRRAQFPGIVLSQTVNANIQTLLEEAGLPRIHL